MQSRPAAAGERGELEEEGDHGREAFPALLVSCHTPFTPESGGLPLTGEADLPHSSELIQLFLLSAGPGSISVLCLFPYLLSSPAGLFQGPKPLPLGNVAPGTEYSRCLPHYLTPDCLTMT